MHTAVRVPVPYVADIYRTLNTVGVLGSSPEAGFFRPAWTKEEDEAIAVIAAEAAKLGLVMRQDAIGNTIFETPGTYESFVESGSHVDTVSYGGNYDGLAGVVSGLLAIRVILEQKRPLRKGLRLRIWRGEESATFSQACKGSRAAFGLLPKETLELTFRGKSFRDLIRASGFDPAPIESGSCTIDQQEIDSVAAHIELHIEQACSLERRGLDIGVVNGIRGPNRCRIELSGSFDHSGGTPMGAEFRRDANLAFAYASVELDKLAAGELAAGEDLVQTIGVINSDPAINERDSRVYQNAVAKVSGYCYFTLDIRSISPAFLRRYVPAAIETVRRAVAPFGVEASVIPLSGTDPLERLDPKIEQTLLECTDALGLKGVAMPSGALHDCLYLGRQTRSDGSLVPIGMIFIPCRDGKSHCPEEYSTPEQIAHGASVLATALASLAA